MPSSPWMLSLSLSLSLPSIHPSTSSSSSLPIIIHRLRTHHFRFLPLHNVRATNQNHQDSISSTDVDLSVFRFTLGIPGLHDSQLPRLLGYSFGSLLAVNHFLTNEVVTAAQMVILCTTERNRSEVLGFFLAVIAINLPTVGMILKGARGGKVSTLNSNDPQMLSLDCSLTETEKEELAWMSYALLRNTNTSALAIWYGGLLCARGCWKLPRNNEVDTIKWLQQTLRKSGILESTTSIYLPTAANHKGWELIPEGVVCLFAQPFGPLCTNETGQQSYLGFMILLSNVPGAYTEKDKKWIASLINKFSNVVCRTRT